MKIFVSIFLGPKETSTKIKNDSMISKPPKNGGVCGNEYLQI